MPVTLKVRNVDRLERALLEGVGARPTIRLGLTITGPASQYFLVWEWGSSRIEKPGPKTTWGTNPDGETVILTKTAPNGYIRVNMPEFRRIVRDEVRAINWVGVKAHQLRFVLNDALMRAAKKCAAVIANAAPYDTGQLAEAIEIAQIGPREINDILSVRARI